MFLCESVVRERTLRAARPIDEVPEEEGKKETEHRRAAAAPNLIRRALKRSHLGSFGFLALPPTSTLVSRT